MLTLDFLGYSDNKAFAVCIVMSGSIIGFLKCGENDNVMVGD